MPPAVRTPSASLGPACSCAALLLTALCAGAPLTLAPFPHTRTHRVAEAPPCPGPDSYKYWTLNMGLNTVGLGGCAGCSGGSWMAACWRVGKDAETHCPPSPPPLPPHSTQYLTTVIAKVGWLVFWLFGQSAVMHRCSSDVGGSCAAGSAGAELAPFIHPPSHPLSGAPAGE